MTPQEKRRIETVAKIARRLVTQGCGAFVAIRAARELYDAGVRK